MKYNIMNQLKPNKITPPYNFLPQYFRCALPKCCMKDFKKDASRSK